MESMPQVGSAEIWKTSVRLEPPNASQRTTMFEKPLSRALYSICRAFSGKRLETNHVAGGTQQPRRDHGKKTDVGSDIVVDHAGRSTVGQKFLHLGFMISQE